MPYLGYLPVKKSEVYADVVELVDSLDLGSNAQACRFESCHPHQEDQDPNGVVVFLLLGGNRTRTDLDATVRWTVARDGWRSRNND